jgi:hypothetical protein
MRKEKLPPRQVIAKRVEDQRRRVWQAQAICDLTSTAARHAQTGGSEAAKFAQAAWVAMEAVSELLDDIAGKLEADVVLDVRAKAEDAGVQR